MTDNIEKIKKYVKEITLVEESGHDWWHILRVYNNAMLINKEEQANQGIIEIIALLHDLYDSKFYTGNVSEKIISTLKELEIYDTLSDEEIKNITYSCENMSYSKNIAEKKELSKKGMIVQDADRLDSIGAIGIARVFEYGGKVKRNIYNPEQERIEIKTEEDYRNQNRDSVNHFYEKLLKLKDLMNTETAKKIALKRHQYMEDYLNEFYKEWNGEL